MRYVVFGFELELNVKREQLVGFLRRVGRRR